MTAIIAAHTLLAVDSKPSPENNEIDFNLNSKEEC